mgnify:CR=1 FL=1
MSNPTYFLQGCPTCGRRLQIRVEYLGRRVVCDHCRGRFVARDPANSPTELHEAHDLLHRANALLESLDAQQAPARNLYPR